MLTGNVWHRRHGHVAHAFHYALTLVLVDLDEPETLLARHPLWGRRWRPVTLRARDYVDGSDRPLVDKVRERARAEELDFSGGQVLMLAQPRALGLLFNPIVLYFHIPRGEEGPDAVLAEVRNTPWGERHFYALNADRARTQLYFRHDKDFHVSPFLPMELSYHWHIDWRNPLSVRIEARDGERQYFEAGMSLDPVQPDRRNLARALFALWRQAVLTRVRIYAQALRLWRRGAHFHRHPDKIVKEGS